MKTLTYRGIAHTGSETSARRPAGHTLSYRGVAHAPSAAPSASTAQDMVYRGVSYQLAPRTGAVTLETPKTGFAGRAVPAS